MKKCCIKDCLSCNLDEERVLFQITNARIEWMNIIKAHQPLNEQNTLYVCDLHFNSNDVKRHSKNVTLKKSALPNISPRVSNESDHGSSTNAGEFVLDNNFSDVFPNNCEDDMQTKTISLQEYNSLTSLVRKMQNSVETLIKQLDSHKMILANCINVSHLSAEQRDVIECMVNGNKKYVAYPESVRKFSLQQQYYSTAAYQSLRLFFNKNLPSKRTIQMWYCIVDGSSGISESSLDIIQERSQAHLVQYNYRLHVHILWDEMAIQKCLRYSNETKSFQGFCTVIDAEDNSENGESSEAKLAKDALVWMVVGPDFKVPVAYELINGLKSTTRAALTLQVIKRVEEAGVVVVSITGDGLPANITTYEELGVKFDENKPYFNSPSHPEQRIYIILDPPHMLKLVRKHFASNKIYHQNQLVNWGLIETIVQKQSLCNFNFCNKLTNLHVNWFQKPMNVKLACETISNSVANTIRLLRKDGYDEFQQSDATEKFIQFFNDAFDILNFGGHQKSDGKFKQILCEHTAENIFNFADRFKEFISQLEYRHKTKNTPLLLSSAEKGFFGFYVDFISLQGIYEDFLINGPLYEFPPFQFSQDHLESFFSLVRNRLGRNDNPSAVEFASAFKKLLVCHPLITSVDHNVLTNATGILTVSSDKKIQPLQLEVGNKLEIDYDLEIDYETVMLTEIEDADQYEQHIWAYIALCVEENFIKNTKSHKFKCNECVEILLSQNDKINDDLLAMKNTGVEKIQQPSESTLKIIIFCNAVMNMVPEDHHSKKNVNIICKNIMRNIDTDDLYNNVDFLHRNHEESSQLHKEEFITLIVETYMSLKSHKICKKITEKEQGELIRHRKKRAYILRGQ